MSDPETLNIDLCKDSSGALSRWLWAAHEEQPHDARARVSLGSEDAEGLRRWIENHPLAEGRTIEIRESEEPKTWVPWLDDGEIDDDRRYLLQNENGKQVETLELIIDGLYGEDYDKQVKAGYLKDGVLSLDSYRPADEWARYLPSMEERLLEAVLEPVLDEFSELHSDDCRCSASNLDSETLRAVRVLALAIPHCVWRYAGVVEVEL